MSHDTRTRQLSRDRDTNPGDAVAHLVALRRAGELDEEVLRLRAFVGDEAAREVAGGGEWLSAVIPAFSSPDLLELSLWLDALLNLAPKRLFKQVALAAGDCAGDLHHAGEGRVRAAICARVLAEFPL